jgi:hypothetical protein
MATTPQTPAADPAVAPVADPTPEVVEVASPALVDPPQGPTPPVTTGPMVPIPDLEAKVVPVQTGVSLHLSSGEVIRASLPDDNSTIAGLLGAGGMVELKHPDGSQNLTVNAAHVVYFYE